MHVHPGAHATPPSRSRLRIPEAFAEVIAEASRSDWLHVSPSDAVREIADDGPFILDVRNRSEWTEHGHIPNAVLVPITDLADRTDDLPGDAGTPILVYCAAGTRALYGTLLLKLLGYTNVKNIAGGLGAWTSAGLPVER